MGASNANDILTQLYNECNPLRAARHTQYVNFADVRGGELFIENICEEFDRAEDHVTALFTGHQGCGKSSELAHLANELISLNPKCAHRRYFPVIVDTEQYLDFNNVSMQEILLAIVAELARELRDREGIELKSSYLQKRATEIRDLLLSDVTSPKVTLDLWKIKTEIALKPADAAARTKVRQHLEPQTTRFIEEINLVLIEARTQLRSREPRDKGAMYHDVVLIVDNLEKLIRAAEHAPGEESEKAIFLDGAAQFTALQAHALFTVPLRLERAIGPRLMTQYGKKTFVLPNVKTFARTTHAPWPDGRAKLLEMLGKRAAPYDLGQVFDSDALDFLLDYCGGSVRQFMVFAQAATLRVRDTPVPLRAAQDAVRAVVPQFQNSIRTAQWALLAELDASPDQAWDTRDEARRELMENLCVLEYMNGPDSGNLFASAETWYAVHPIVRQLSQFKTARAALSL